MPPSVLDAHQVEKELRAFIRDNFLFGRKRSLTASDSLIENGVIDSTGVMELIEHLEKTYNIVLEDHELVPENLDSISRIVAFVQRKVDSAPKALDARAITSSQR